MVDLSRYAMGLGHQVVADDHYIVRQGLRTLLEAQADFQVVGEAADGLEVIQVIERLQPDMLVLDLMMPGLNGLDVLRRVDAVSPETRVVIFSMHANERYVLEALKHGASGYVLKEASADELVRAVREIAAGRHYLSPPLSERAIHAYIESTKDHPEPYATLTQREREVLHLVVEGCTNTEIGERLFISVRTVEKHRTNLMRKLGLRTQAELIRYALQQEILPLG